MVNNFISTPLQEEFVCLGDSKPPKTKPVLGFSLQNNARVLYDYSHMCNDQFTVAKLYNQMEHCKQFDIFSRSLHHSDDTCCSGQALAQVSALTQE